MVVSSAVPVQVNKLEITTDKSLLAAAGNPHIRLYEVASGNSQAVADYDSHTNNVTAVRLPEHLPYYFLASPLRQQLNINQTSSRPSQMQMSGQSSVHSSHCCVKIRRSTAHAQKRLSRSFTQAGMLSHQSCQGGQLP